MKIVLFTFYFPPDLSAGSFRAKALVDALSHQLGERDIIDVITTSPNRYKEHYVQAGEIEKFGIVTIHRIPVPLHQSGMLDQVRSFGYFAWGALRLARKKRWDVVIGTSSRLFTATLATVVAKSHKASLYLDIRDIFSDTLKDVLLGVFAKILMPIVKLIERWTINSADKVNLVSGGFLPFFKAIAPGQHFTVYSNGIDPEFSNLRLPKKIGPKRPPVVLFAGNIGEGQGLHKILPAVALKSNAHFKIIGAGGRRNTLVEALNLAAVRNVELIDPMPRSQLIDQYLGSDFLFLHLNDFPAFEKVIPSKVFEYAATGKPILAGISGYGAKFISENIAGADVFAPCDADAMISAINKQAEGADAYDRTEFIVKFDRKTIMAQMADEIIQSRKSS